MRFCFTQNTFTILCCLPILIMIIVECLYTNSCEYDDTETNGKSFFDDTHHIESNDNHEYHDHEPETS